MPNEIKGHNPHKEYQHEFHAHKDQRSSTAVFDKIVTEAAKIYPQEDWITLQDNYHPFELTNIATAATVTQKHNAIRQMQDYAANGDVLHTLQVGLAHDVQPHAVVAQVKEAARNQLHPLHKNEKKDEIKDWLQTLWEHQTVTEQQRWVTTMSEEEQQHPAAAYAKRIYHHTREALKKMEAFATEFHEKHKEEKKLAITTWNGEKSRRQ